MPIGNLPPKAAELFDEVYNRYLSGECKKDKACASKRAWGAVKNAGYFKGTDGKWHKKSDIEMSMAELSFYISRASLDKTEQKMRWFAVASDTDRDDYEERMSLGLYNDFILRAMENESPPDELCTDAWCGGMPYLSLAHYSDLNGKGIVGPVNKLYIDGKKLKSQGIFEDTELGRACFKSVLNDLYSEEKSEQEKIRISIGFIDWAHYHGNFFFERKTITDRCPMCALGVGDKMFAKGHLLHLALTRLPVNPRTDILPLVEERSMTTQKEDAESIVGKEKADELDELEKEANLVGKSEAVVERAEEEAEEEVVAETVVEEKEIVESETIETTEEKTVEEEVEPEAEETEVQELSKQTLEQIKELILPSSEPHVLDTAFETLRSQYDEVIEMELTPDEKLQLLQESYTEIGAVVKSSISAVSAEEAQEDASEVVTRAELKELFTPLTEKISLLVAQVEGMAGAKDVRAATSQQRRSHSQAELELLSLKAKGSKEEKPNSIDAIAHKSVRTTGY